MIYRRVVVSGLGMITPLGASLESSWDGLLAGYSGIGPITSFDTKGYPVSIGGTVPEFDISEYLSPKETRRMDCFIKYGFCLLYKSDAAAYLLCVDLIGRRINKKKRSD